MILFSEQLSTRLEYVTSFIGHQLQGEPLTITNDKAVYLQYTGAKINYSNRPVAPAEIRIIPHRLLFEKGITPQHVSVAPGDDFNRIFINEGDSGFDLLSAIFFLVTRYEEYLPHEKDSYGRYAYQDSIAFKNGFLEIPVVDRWIISLYRQLLDLFGEEAVTGPPEPGAGAPQAAGDPASEYNILPSSRKFRFRPTYDIDMAWSYRQKGFVRNAAGMLRSIFTGKFSAASKRFRVWTGHAKDPFDSFEWLDNLHKKYEPDPLYFFLLAERSRRYDKNNDPASDEMRDLVKNTSATYVTGIHPSWQSGDNKMLVQAELNLLRGLSGKVVTDSRQHYIRFTLPDTYRELIGLGITDEYSMGYGTVNGFRASTCSAFYWFDLLADKPTSLVVHPFCYMDANTFYAPQASAAEALREMLHYLEVTREVGGTLVTIWHNHLLGTDKQFAGWKEVYAGFVGKAVAH